MILVVVNYCRKVIDVGVLVCYLQYIYNKEERVNEYVWFV